MKSELKALHPREYRIWKAMKARCYSPSNADMGHYQEYGIKVCERWLHSFSNFFQDMGEAPKGYSIDRIDNLSDYCPENCRWADNYTQVRNRSITINYTYNGMTMCVKDWSKYFNINYTTLRQRLRNGYTFEEAVSSNFNKIAEKKRNKSSGIKGVCYHKGHKKWQALAYEHGEQIRLGEYKEKEDAILAVEEYQANKNKLDKSI